MISNNAVVVEKDHTNETNDQLEMLPATNVGKKDTTVPNVTLSP